MPFAQASCCQFQLSWRTHIAHIYNNLTTVDIWYACYSCDLWLFVPYWQQTPLLFGAYKNKIHYKIKTKICVTIIIRCYKEGPIFLYRALSLFLSAYELALEKLLIPSIWSHFLSSPSFYSSRVKYQFIWVSSYNNCYAWCMWQLMPEGLMWIKFVYILFCGWKSQSKVQYVIKLLLMFITYLKDVYFHCHR